MICKKMISGLTAVLTLGVLAFGLTVSASDAPETDQYDVVIVGGGGAGMSAAIGAYDAGAENIVVLESLSFMGGGTARSGGGFYSSEVSYDVDEGFEEFNHTTVDELYEMGMEACAGADEDIQRFYAENVYLYLEKLNDWGYHWGQIYDGNLYMSSDDSYASGHVLVKALKEQVDKRGIEVRLNTTANKILTDDSGAITGVAVDSKDKGEYEISCSSVVLATGGFSANAELMAEYDPKAAAVYTPNSQGSMGIGLKMAEELGAELVNMDHLYYVICTPENIYCFFPEDFLKYGALFVDMEGNRFVDEENTDSEGLMDAIINATGNTVYAVFTEDMLGSYLDDMGGEDLNIQTNTLLCADSLDELAALMDVDPEKLNASLTEDGNAEAYQNGPYYALKETTAVLHTMGGLVIDTEAQVYREDGTVIDGLYAAGEVVGNSQVSDWYYGVSDAVLMGEKAGANSAHYVEENTGFTTHVSGESNDEKDQEAIKGNFTDGVYEGTGSGLHGDITLQVTVEDSSITEISVLACEETDALLEGVTNTLIPAIIENQSADVDTVAGATISSLGVIEAVENALG